MNKDFIELDMDACPRRAQFDFFRSMGNPYVGMTVQVDITRLLEKVKREGLPFFLTMLYVLDRAANDVPQMRQRIRGDRVIEYARCYSSFTVALPDETYCYRVVDTDLPFEQYLENEKTDGPVCTSYVGENEGDQFFYVSSTPWVTFSDLTLPTPVPADSVPRLTISRYFELSGRTLISVNVLVNHALLDGRHIAHFYEHLNEEIDLLCKE